MVSRVPPIGPAGPQGLQGNSIVGPTGPTGPAGQGGPGQIFVAQFANPNNTTTVFAGLNGSNLTNPVNGVVATNHAGGLPIRCASGRGNDDVRRGGRHFDVDAREERHPPNLDGHDQRHDSERYRDE